MSSSTAAITTQSSSSCGGYGGSISSTGMPQAASSVCRAASNAAIEAGDSDSSCATSRGVARIRRAGASRGGVHEGAAVGAPAVGPRSTSRSTRASAIEVASGPLVESSIQEGGGHAPISPVVGLSPTSPQKAAGILIEPPPSVPVASGVIPVMSATALPPEDPPGDHSGAHGLRVSPNSRLAVKPSNANSGTLVFPTTIAPAARRRATASQSLVAGGASARRSDPKVVGIPEQSSLSLTSSGRPASGPGSSPAATRASRARASARAPSARSAITAFSAALDRSMRSRLARTSSSDETRRARTASASGASITAPPVPDR